MLFYVKFSWHLCDGTIYQSFIPSLADFEVRTKLSPTFFVWIFSLSYLNVTKSNHSDRDALWSEPIANMPNCIVVLNKCIKIRVITGNSFNRNDKLHACHLLTIIFVAGRLDGLGT